MNEFDMYMQLGNQLENEGKIIIAYAAYLGARQNSGDTEREVIENYLRILGNKLSGKPKEWNNEVKKQILQWIKEGNVKTALVCVCQIFEQLNGKEWIDTEVAILYQCLMIYQEECRGNIVPWHIQGKDMEEIRTWYYRLKFMIRRFDMGIYEEAEFIEYVKKENISVIALAWMTQTICYFPQKVYGYLKQVFEEVKMQEYADFFQNIGGEAEEHIVNQFVVEQVESAEKVAFIIAVSEEQIYREAVYYIRHLRVPENMEVEIIPIRGASSIATAYNQGMVMTNAKYKIYMHQDAMIVNPYMLYEMCHIFQDEKIGMIGVAGAGEMPQSGMWWKAEQKKIFCRIYQDIIMEHNISSKNVIMKEYQPVKVIDGVLMITQYDIPWREDLFQNWHFYDSSQSMEFYKKDKQIVIPRQENIWCLHEQKWNKGLGTQYHESKEIFLEEYKELLEKE